MEASTRIDETIGSIPPAWVRAIGPAASPARLAPIAEFVAARRQVGRVLPEPERVFAALHATSLDTIQAVILGQDPYPNKEHATGLAFSVPADLDGPLPRSLRRIRTELRSDCHLRLPDHGSLEAWTRYGVLLLNTTLTVDEGEPGSHWRARWGTLTDAIITAVANQDRPVAFLLWGRHAQAKTHLIANPNVFAVSSPHPMARSKVGFLGSRPFSRANAGLNDLRADPIVWSLDD
ncbi:MAG: uracil-DNA glycosylase [Isosphaeraceae bacterium]|nr:uracil-DNA glycosylase [Isosphaeraceae bacterium]